MKVRRTKLGYQWALLAQYKALQASCGLYDAGHLGEIVRIANSIFILVGRGQRSHTSILDGMGASDTRLWSTMSVKNQSATALILVEALPIHAPELGVSNTWFLSSQPRGNAAVTGSHITIDEWLDEIVLRSQKCTLSRRMLLRVMRDREGGAHFDNALTDPNYVSALLDGVGFMYKQSAERETAQPVGGELEATVRQMAIEILQSLKAHQAVAQIASSRPAQAGNHALSTAPCASGARLQEGNSSASTNLVSTPLL